MATTLRWRVSGNGNQPCCGSWRSAWNPAASPTQPNGSSMPSSSHASAAVRRSHCMFLACPACRQGCGNFWPNGPAAAMRRWCSTNSAPASTPGDRCLPAITTMRMPERNSSAGCCTRGIRCWRASAAPNGTFTGNWSCWQLICRSNSSGSNGQPPSAQPKLGCCNNSKPICCWAERGARAYREWRLPWSCSAAS